MTDFERKLLAALEHLLTTMEVQNNRSKTLSRIERITISLFMVLVLGALFTLLMRG